MKTVLLVATILAAALVTGCKRSEKPATDTTVATTQQVEKAQVAASEVAKQVPETVIAEKTQFMATMQAQLAELNQNIDELSARIANSTDSARAEAAPKLAALREQAEQLRKQLADAADATPSTWDSIKADSEKAYAALKNGVAQARQWVSDKIAP